LNKGKNISIYQQLENLELALRSAESIGCHIINVRPKDIRDGKEHLILGILWQTIQVTQFFFISNLLI
jgi:plastin-1